MSEKLYLTKYKSLRFTIKRISLSMVNKSYFDWFNDRTTKKYIEFSPKNINDLKKNVTFNLKKKDVLFFGIFFQKKHIGNIKFEKINLNTSSAYFGILIGEKKWRQKGIAREVLEKSMDVLYEKFGIFKFFLGVNKENKDAIKLYSNLGFMKIKSKKKDVINQKMFKNLLKSKIVIGTAQFGSQYGINNNQKKISNLEIKKIKNYALKNNINSFETAQSYGNAESRLGILNMKNLSVITKIKGLNQEYDQMKIYALIKDSLKKLKLKQVFGLMIHDAKDLQGSNGLKIFHFLKTLKKKKIIKNIGVAVYDLDELSKLTKKFKFDIISIPCSIFDRRFLKSKIVVKLKKLNTKIYARSIFLQGLLLMKHKNIPNYFYKWNNHFLKLDKLSNQEKMSKLEFCINFVISNPLIDKVIIGCDNIIQFKQIVNINFKKNFYLKNHFKINNEKLLNPSKWQIRN